MGCITWNEVAASDRVIPQGVSMTPDEQQAACAMVAERMGIRVTEFHWWCNGVGREPILGEFDLFADGGRGALAREQAEEWLEANYNCQIRTVRTVGGWLWMSDLTRPQKAKMYEAERHIARALAIVEAFKRLGGVEG